MRLKIRLNNLKWSAQPEQLVVDLDTILVDLMDTILVDLEGIWEILGVILIWPLTQVVVRMGFKENLIMMAPMDTDLVVLTIIMTARVLMTI